MSLLKNERTIRLDDLHRVLAETLDLYQELAEHLEDTALRRRVNGQAAAQKRVLEDVAERRRVLGDLPQAADPEHARLEAIGAHVRDVVLPGETQARHARSLLEAAEEVAQGLEGVLDRELDPDIRRLLSELRDANTRFVTALRARS